MAICQMNKGKPSRPAPRGAHLHGLLGHAPALRRLVAERLVRVLRRGIKQRLLLLVEGLQRGQWAGVRQCQGTVNI